MWRRKPAKPGEQPSYEKETAYLISSLDLQRHTPQEFLALNRGHWGIENKLHYVRDVTMGEDACRVRTGSAPQVLAGIRNSVIALARTRRLDQHRRRTPALRRQDRQGPLTHRDT